MTRLLLTLIAAMGGLLLAALWRIDHVTASRDAAVTAAAESDARVESLRVTLRLQRELANDQAAIETIYLEEKRSAEDEAERLRRCLADGTCGLRVAATCVRVDGAGPAAGEPDAGAPRLTAAAERAYPTLVAGLRAQRAQITGLQAELTALHHACKIGAAP